MKIDLDQVLKDFDGKAIKQPKSDGEEAAKDMTLAIVCTGALSNPLEEDKNLAAEKAVERWKLAVRVHGGGEQEFTPEELSLIRGRLSKVYSILIAGQAISLLE